MDMQREGLRFDNDVLRNSHAYIVHMYERDTGQKLSFPLPDPIHVEKHE